MEKNIFASMGGGFAQPGPWTLPPVLLKASREEAERDRERLLRRPPLPSGVTLQFPYIVKIEGEGEYVVGADGTEVFYSIPKGHWEPLKTDRSRSFGSARRRAFGSSDFTNRRYAIRNLEGPVFCPPGTIPQQTGVPGESRCIPYSAPSTMIGPQPQGTVSTMVPPAWPTGRTFPVGPYWGWRNG
jgi:hypothetical protein